MCSLDWKSVVFRKSWNFDVRCIGCQSSLHPSQIRTFSHVELSPVLRWVCVWQSKITLVVLIDFQWRFFVNMNMFKLKEHPTVLSPGRKAFLRSLRALDLQHREVIVEKFLANDFFNMQKIPDHDAPSKVPFCKATMWPPSRRCTFLRYWNSNKKL